MLENLHKRYNIQMVSGIISSATWVCKVGQSNTKVIRYTKVICSGNSDLKFLFNFGVRQVKKNKTIHS